MEVPTSSQEQTETVNETENLRLFEYSDTVVECSCGGIYVLDELKPGGLIINLPPVEGDKYRLELGCTKCNTTIKLYLRESAEEDIKRLKELEKIKGEVVEELEEAHER